MPLGASITGAVLRRAAGARPPRPRTSQRASGLSASRISLARSTALPSSDRRGRRPAGRSSGRRTPGHPAAVKPADVLPDLLVRSRQQGRCRPLRTAGRPAGPRRGNDPGRPRPAAVAAFWTTLATRRSSTGRARRVTHPSPIRPARSIAASDMPPSRIGGPGRCTGGGSAGLGGIYRTTLRTRDRLTTAPAARRCTLPLARPAAPCSAPDPMNSSGIQPFPIPRSSRPPESTSTVAACLRQQRRGERVVDDRHPEPDRRSRGGQVPERDHRVEHRPVDRRQRGRGLR